LAAFLIAVFANFLFQLFQKPTEIARYAAGDVRLSPEELWLRYADLFHAHATRDMTPDFLAALAYVESSGNAFAAPRWEIRAISNWRRWYSPRSSAAGLMQFTDATFDRAREYCVHQGRVVHRGAWQDLDACWFSGWSTRLSPSDSIEAAAAYLQSQVDESLGAVRSRVSLRDRQRLAAVIHLCGPGRAGELISSRFLPGKLSPCGKQSPGEYVRRVEQMRTRFLSISRGR